MSSQRSITNKDLTSNQTNLVLLLDSVPLHAGGIVWIFSTDELEEVDSFHKELLRAAKEFENLQNKPTGTYNSNWHTSVEDKTVRDSKGNTTYISVQKTQMSASYTRQQKDDDCVIL